MTKKEDIKYAEIYSKWYSWGSPVGLSIFILTLVIIAAIVKLVFFP